MRVTVLSSEDVLTGYDAVSSLYPYIPSLSHWRAWEYAAYQKYNLEGHILDLGCGDGQYFKLIWPQATNVVGVDMDPVMSELGARSGVYRKVHTAQAHQIPEKDEAFDHVFANCSLEHMDHLGAVLAEVYRCLKPDGSLLCSVVTDRFIQWSLLPNLVSMAGFDQAAAKLQKDFLDFHHLANPFSVQEWQDKFCQAKLVVEEHIPILPMYNSGIFLLMESLWHVKQANDEEMGNIIFPFLSSNPNFPSAFRKIFDGLLEMETDWHNCSGAVFLARKTG